MRRIMMASMIVIDNKEEGTESSDESYNISGNEKGIESKGENNDVWARATLGSNTDVNLQILHCGYQKRLNSNSFHPS